jgi:hypothetical protein
MIISRTIFLSNLFFLSSFVHYPDDLKCSVSGSIFFWVGWFDVTGGRCLIQCDLARKGEWGEGKEPYKKNKKQDNPVRSDARAGSTIHSFIDPFLQRASEIR